MPSVSVYEPPGCCSSGVCGPGVETSMVQFASALEWMGKNGAQVSRFNLGYQPAAFVDNAAVRAAIDSDGMDCLPLVMIDGEIVSKGVYLSRDELLKMAGLVDTQAADEPAAEKSGCCSTPEEEQAARQSGCR